MKIKTNESIIILGCGLSGMLTSLSLAHEGIPSIILEKKTVAELENPNDPRTTSLNDSSINFMSRIMIWDSLKSFAEAIKDIYVCQNMTDNIFHIHQEGEQNGKTLGLMIKNVDFRRELFELVRKNQYIKVIDSSIYDNIIPSKNHVTLDIISGTNQQTAKANIVIAADGKFSEAKKLLFKNRHEKDFKQKALVFDISHTLNHEGGAIEHFLKRGSFATLPLPGGFSSSVVWVDEKEIADFYVKQDKEFLAGQIEKFTGGSLGSINLISESSSFPLDAFFSEKYYEGMLALVADSAHCMHPLAGQGLNMGIKDVESLTNLIAKYNKLGLEYNQIMLSNYQKSRRMDNIIMVKIVETINTVFTSKSKVLNKITQTGLSLIDKTSILKNILIKYAKGAR